jgi:hypothetical protein
LFYANLRGEYKTLSNFHHPVSVIRAPVCEGTKETMLRRVRGIPQLPYPFDPFAFLSIYYANS